MTCLLCKDITNRVYSLLEDPSLAWAMLYPFPTFPYCPNFTTLRKSQKAGCGLCGTLLDSAQRQIGKEVVEQFESQNQSISYQIDRYMPESAAIRLCITGLTFYVGWDDDPFAMRNFSASFFVELVSPAQRIPFAMQVIGRRIASDPGSKESIDLVKEWMLDCCSSHSLCPKPSQTILPTRVIDVGSPTEECKPRLILSEGKLGAYAALTHVWGGFVPVRTVTKNLPDHLSQLPMFTLPPSFRDSVLVTRSLGMRYLWIDALCIIQDSAQDWAAECARMGDIYRGSAITIAAVDAQNSQAGFLKQRTFSSLNTPSITLPATAQRPRDLDIEVIPRDPLAHLDHYSPLSARAWCLQEKLLSPRILYFGADQTYFNCNTLTRLEAYGVAPPSMNLYNCLNFGKSWLAEDFQRLKQNPISSKSTAVWHRIVNEYATRALTKVEDKLPALSGLALDFAKITGFRYLAGLWLEQINEDLNWVVESPSLKSYAKDPTPYTAPSWSWASYHGPLEFRGAQVAVTKVLRAETTLASLDPFGQILNGTLVLAGRCKEATVKYREESRISDFTYKSQGQSLFDIASIGGRELEVGRCSFDYLFDRVAPASGSAEESKMVHCLALQREPRSLRSTVMILARVDDAVGSHPSYRRIGIGYVQIMDNGASTKKEIPLSPTWYPQEAAEDEAKDWFDGCEERDWIIV